MAEDKESKKHPASEQKKRQLKKKGQTPKSTDVPMAFGLLAAFGILVSMKGFYMEHFKEMMQYCLEQIVYTDQIDLAPLILYAMVKVALLSGPIMIGILIIGMVSHLGQSGLILSGESLKPDIKKINPMSKLKQWFSMKSLQELAKSLAKILVASMLGFFVWKGSLEAINDAVWLDALGLLLLGGSIIKKMLLQIIILYVVVAAIDFMFQRKNFATQHKMTDKEVKDEYKQSEGDPYMKGKRRQVAQQIAFNASQENVPQSDVVVINPTELAIAIKYDPELSPVPFVVSKGEQRHADDIRSAARGAGVPVVRNKPLARALFEMCEIGDLVPEDLYRPVAEVLAYVFALKEQAAEEPGQPAAAAQQAQQGDTHAVGATVPGQQAVGVASLSADEQQVHELAEIQVPVSLPAGQSAAHAGMAMPAAAAMPVAMAPVPAAPGMSAPAAAAQPGAAWAPVATGHHPAAAAPGATWHPQPQAYVVPPVAPVAPPFASWQPHLEPQAPAGWQADGALPAAADWQAQAQQHPGTVGAWYAGDEAPAPQAGAAPFAWRDPQAGGPAS